MPRGGARAGSGRPTKAATQAARQSAGQAAIAKFSEQAFQDLPDVYAALKDLALGVWYEGCSKCRKQRHECNCREPVVVNVYQRIPDRYAAEAIVSHTKGKAATADHIQPETHITLIAKDVPRPGRRTEEEVSLD